MKDATKAINTYNGFVIQKIELSFSISLIVPPPIAVSNPKKILQIIFVILLF